jgi:hypothetical protein
MQDPMDDIATQARQGSVAAIIQTLNEKLANVGVRTRAVFADGVLQLLCEAAQEEQLEKSQLIPQVKKILEDIAPRNIRRVRINSRIVREQQLLWLEEISRDPENQLLWSEEIILAKPNIFKRLAQNLNQQKTSPYTKKKTPFPQVSSRSQLREKSKFQWGIVSGVGLSLLLVILGWLLYTMSNSSNPEQKQASTGTQTSTTNNDSFVQAVRLAEQASTVGKNIQTSAQWLDVASKWERAADLMAEVKPTDPRYKTAQNRIAVYRKNSEVAQKQARRNIR